MQLQIVGRPIAYNGGICGKKNKVKEELAHAYYSRKTVVIGFKVCITNDADKKETKQKYITSKDWPISVPDKAMPPRTAIAQLGELR